MKWGVRRASKKSAANERLEKKALKYDVKAAKAQRKSEKFHSSQDLGRSNRAAKKAAQAEAADNNNSLSPEERAIFQDFATKGRRSTEAKKVVTEDDRKRAVEGVAAYTRLTEEEPKKTKPKSGSR